MEHRPKHTYTHHLFVDVLLHAVDKIQWQYRNPYKAENNIKENNWFLISEGFEAELW